MFSRILIKLIDQSIVPAVLLIATRIISAVLISKTHSVEFAVGPGGITYGSTGDYIYVNSYSTLAMLLVLGFSLLYILVKAWVFHDTHITPRMTARLFGIRMHSLIQSSYNLYTQGTIWLSYLFFITTVSGLMLYFELLMPFVFYTALGITLILTVLFILDIENEVKKPESSFSLPEEEEE